MHKHKYILELSEKVKHIYFFSCACRQQYTGQFRVLKALNTVSGTHRSLKGKIEVACRQRLSSEQFEPTFDRAAMGNSSGHIIFFRHGGCQPIIFLPLLHFETYYPD